MPDVPVTLTPWFDAKDNPPSPDDGWPVATDGGVATYVESEGQDLRPTGGAWYHGESSDYMDPQPSVWCDPSPPDLSDPLTVTDLLVLANLAQIGASEVWEPTEEHLNREAYDAALARVRRLRSALNAIDAKYA